jgi:hypothetical protein
MLTNENETEVSEPVFNLRDAADELISDETNQASPENSAKSGQSQSENPDNNLSDVDKAKALLNEQATPVEGVVDPKILEEINRIGAIHSGNPIKIESIDQLKELVQKGFDYTKKTMAHSEEVKAKQEEFAKTEAAFTERSKGLEEKEVELHGVSFQNQVINSMVDKWQTSDPELFAYIQQEYQREIGDYEKNQPIIAQYENKFKELENRFAQLETGKQKEEMGSIKQSWEAGIAELQTARGPKMKELGVVPNWDKVKDVWSADASGKMTHEEAFLAVHAADILKANDALIKKLQAQAKVQSSAANRNGIAHRQSGNATTAIQNGRIGDFLRQEAANY